jgi:hypothetical protein
MSIRKILGRTGLVLIAFVSVLLVVRAVLNYTTGKKLENFFAEAKAKGLPMSYADLGPTCAGPENAHPFMKAAIDLYDGGYQKKVKPALELGNLYDGRPVDDKARSGIREGIAANRRSIDLLLEAAGRPCFQDPDLSDLGVTRYVASTLYLMRLLSFEACFRAEGGDVRGALDEWVRGLRLARLTLQRSNVMMALISIANARSLLSVLDRIVAGRPLEVDDLQAVLKELDVAAWRTAVAGSWKGARAVGIETARQILSGTSPEFISGITPRFWLWLGRPLVRTQAMRQYSEAAEIESLFGVPYAQSRERMNAYDRSHEKETRTGRLYFNGYSGISAMALKNASLEALMETARIGLAARIYLAREKHWPAAVADLVPGILIEEPMDPFTGKPFVFRVDKDGLLVYSLGSNEKDDGGRGTFSIAQLVTPKDDDWAWRDKIRN